METPSKKFFNDFFIHRRKHQRINEQTNELLQWFPHPSLRGEMDEETTDDGWRSRKPLRKDRDGRLGGWMGKPLEMDGETTEDRQWMKKRMEEPLKTDNARTDKSLKTDNGWRDGETTEDGWTETPLKMNDAWRNH